MPPKFKEEKIVGCHGVLAGGLERNKDPSIALKGLCQVKEHSDGLDSHSKMVHSKGLIIVERIK